MPCSCMTVKGTQKLVETRHVICKHAYFLQLNFFLISILFCGFLFSMMSSVAKSFREKNLKFSAYVLDMKDNDTNVRSNDLRREAGNKHSSKSNKIKLF
jgi:hypothetical protein